tara:strand:- start:2585 stop:3268 length:684 start_codon:yes stop_codon:yes gene_type:complete
MSTPFWFKDISILYDKNYLMEIIPKKEYDFNRKLNAVVRFTIYYGILLYIFKRDKNILCLPFITVVITVYLHKTSKDDKQDDNFKGLMNTKSGTNLSEIDMMIDEINTDVYRIPEIDNPMMNQNTFDLYENKKAIPTYNNPGVKRKVEETLDSQVFKDSNDLFNRRNSQRQWYTMPNTEAMNKQTEFAKWCYMTPPTCKEGNGLQCANNLHNRLNRNSADVAPPSPA